MIAFFVKTKTVFKKIPENNIGYLEKPMLIVNIGFSK